MISAEYYSPIIYNLVLLLCFMQYYKYKRKNKSLLLARINSTNNLSVVFFCLILIFFIGLRPISWRYFGDTGNYARIYRSLVPSEVVFDFDKEWLFNGFMSYCKSMGFDVSIFFLLVEFGYIGFMYWACKRLIPNNIWLAMLFCISAYSFFTYGTNGIRNGLACSIMMLALSFFVSDKKGIIIALVLSFFAYGIHHSIILPLLAMIASFFLITDVKKALVFWLFSIVVSLVAGNTMTTFFMNLGFDDRMQSYGSVEMDSNTFSSVGFRWDFLLYSAMPILLAYYVCVKKHIYNYTYTIIANTYIITNAFWVMVIRASYSNRFAYLSWFLYPIALSYPLLKISIWKNQNKKTVLILMLHVVFTYFMWLIGK